MKAAVYHGKGSILIENVNRPVASDDNIILEVLCCLICGTDLKIWLGMNDKIVPPRILGHETVGRIVHIGKADTNLKIGDRVTIATTMSCGECEYCRAGLGNLCKATSCVGTTRDGAFAEYVEIPARSVKNLIKIPDGVSNEAASVCEPLSCAINGHEKINVKSGDSVAIIGGGPLGALHALLAKAEGAKKVFLVCGSGKRRELLEGLDGVTLIDRDTRDAAAVIAGETGGLGADKVVVCAPVAKAFLQAFDMVRKGGAISYFASLPKGNSELLIDTRTIHYNELTVAGVSDSRPEHVQKAVDYLASGALNAEAVITHRLPLDRLADGLELMKNRQCLKVAIYPKFEMIQEGE